MVALFELFHQTQTLTKAIKCVYLARDICQFA